MLVLFPDKVLTEDDLDKFSMDQLQKMCTGAWLSNRGSKTDLLSRLLKYGTQNKQIPTTPSKVDQWKRKYKSRKITVTDRNQLLSAPDSSTTTSRKRKFTEEEQLSPHEKKTEKID